MFLFSPITSSVKGRCMFEGRGMDNLPTNFFILIVFWSNPTTSFLLGSAIFKKLDHLTTFSPHRRSPSPPGRGYQSPCRVPHSNHVYAPILPSRAYDYTTPAPSPPPPAHQETLPPVGNACTSSSASEEAPADLIANGPTTDSCHSGRAKAQTVRNVQQALYKRTNRRGDRVATKKQSSVKRPRNTEPESGDKKVAAVTSSTELVALEKNSAEVSTGSLTIYHR